MGQKLSCANNDTNDDIQKTDHNMVPQTINNASLLDVSNFLEVDKDMKSWFPPQNCHKNITKLFKLDKVIGNQYFFSIVPN